MKLPSRPAVQLFTFGLPLVGLLCSGCAALGEVGAAALEGEAAAGALARGAAAEAGAGAAARAAAGAATRAAAGESAAGAAARAAGRGGGASAARAGARAVAGEAAGPEISARVASEAGGEARAAGMRSSAPEMSEIGRALETDGTTETLLEASKRSIGAEPEIAWAEHFDKDGVFKGRSEFTRTEVRHFDDQGNFTGREARSQSGSTVYDRDGRVSGRTDARSGRTTAYDSRGMYKGFSERNGSTIRGYDHDNVYTGSSKLYPWPKNYSLAPLALLAAAPYKRSVDVTVTGLRFFVGSHPANGCQAQFVESIPYAMGRPVYLQVDSKIPQAAVTPVNIAYEFIVEEEGFKPFSGRLDQAIKPGWSTACSWTAAFSLTAQDADRVVSVRLMYAGRELAQAALRVTR